LAFHNIKVAYKLQKINLEKSDLDGHNLGTNLPKPIEWIFTQLQPLTAPNC